MYDIQPKEGLGCFFCGEPDGGLKNNPAEFYRPCTGCAAMMRLGLTLIGSKTEKASIPPIAKAPNQPDIYPTGRWVVLEENLARKVMGEKMVETMKQSGKAIIPDDIVKAVQDMCGKDFDATYLTMDDLKAEPITPQKQQ